MGAIALSIVQLAAAGKLAWGTVLVEPTKVL